MPHKHKRKRGDDGDLHDLPPSQRARPLPVFPAKQYSRHTGGQVNEKRQRKEYRNDHDTPRAFRRIMEFAQGRKATPSGLDDGKATRSSDVLKEHSKDELHIKPGEDLRSFATRVNAALPIAGLTTKTKTKDGKDLLGLKVRRTRKEVKMHKLYAQWRAEERIIQERKEEERELAAERGLGHAAADTGQDAMIAEGKASARRGKKGKMRGRDQDDDPWRELTKKRGEGRIGLHDIVQAPPDLLHRKQRKQLLMGGAIVDVENVPRSAGSLRRREELQTARDDVVEAYRRIREHELAKTNA